MDFLNVNNPKLTPVQTADGPRMMNLPAPLWENPYLLIDQDKHEMAEAARRYGTEVMGWQGVYNMSDDEVLQLTQHTPSLMRTLSATMGPAAVATVFGPLLSEAGAALASDFAPVMRALEPVNKVAGKVVKVVAPVNTVAYGTKAVEDAARGDFRSAAGDASIAVMNALPFINKLNNWQKFGAAVGLAMVPEPSLARDTKKNWDNFMNEVNTNFNDPLYIPTLEDVNKYLEFLEDLGYFVQPRQQELSSDSTRVIGYGITSKTEDYPNPESEGAWEGLSELYKYMPWFAYRAGWATKKLWKPLINLDARIKFAADHPKLYKFAKKAKKYGPELGLALPLAKDAWDYIKYRFHLGDTSSGSENLSDELRKAVFQVISLLQRRNEVSLGNLKPLDKTGYSFDPYDVNLKDTIPPAETMRQDTAAGQPSQQPTVLIDTSIINNAPPMLNSTE